MEIKFFQAECGDASCMRFLGNDNKYHNIFIDSGFERTFRHALENEIQNIVGNNEAIDLWIISHIHDDHIGGVVKYIDTLINYGTLTGNRLVSAKSNAIKQEFFAAFMGEFFASARKRFSNFVRN